MQDTRLEEPTTDADAVILDELLASLPLTDNHLHIEGAISLEHYREVVEVPDGWVPSGWAPGYRYETFTDFENFILGYADQWFVSPDRYHQSAAALFAAKKIEGVRYLECSFAAIVSHLKGLSIESMVEAIQSAVPEGLEVRLFMGLHHNSLESSSAEALEDALSLEGLDGIDLHGPEGYPVSRELVGYWEKARSMGKATKAHAGELGGAWHVAEAVEKLGVRRVEHGFRAIEDQRIVDLLRENRVVLDVCPISNLKLRTVESMATHPIKSLVEAGITCTINTDDPFIFGNRIGDDYRVLLMEGGLALETLIGLARNGLEHALLEDEPKRGLLATFDGTVSRILHKYGRAGDV
ncbi:MAG: adenosine deaminase [Puniceicoccaceae bacterium]